MGWELVSKALTDAKERQEAFQRGDYGKARAFPLIVKTDNPGLVSFIDKEPYVAKVHTMPRVGKSGFITKKCLERNCPFCEGGDKAKVRVFFTVVDHRRREYEGKTYQNDVRYYECSAGTADMLQRLLAKKKKSLEENVVEISKFGSGTSTTTMFDFLDPSDVEGYDIPANAESFDFNEVFGVGDSSSNASEAGPRYD